MMHSGINRKIKNGIAVSGSHPIAIEARTGRRLGHRIEIRIILNEINQSFAGFRFCGMLPFVSFHFKLDCIIATTWRSRKGRNLVLCQNRQWKKYKRDCNNFAGCSDHEIHLFLSLLTGSDEINCNQFKKI